MNANRLCLARVFTVILLALGTAADGQVPITNFRAGAYRGTLRLTTSIVGAGETTATLKVKGRSTGNSILQMIGTPQLAGSVMGVGDDLPVKAFRLEYGLGSQSMMLMELINADAVGASQGLPLDSLIAGKNIVRAETSHSRTLGITTIEFTTRVVLTRVGD
jgi:hypothetical protein